MCSQSSQVNFRFLWRSFLFSALLYPAMRKIFNSAQLLTSWKQFWLEKWSHIDERFRPYVRTALVVLPALCGLWLIWWHYTVAPWTRDGKVRAEVVKIAPEVSGTVTGVRVTDNQFVHRGDVLFVIDPIRFKLALQQAQAVVSQREADFRVKSPQAQRRSQLLSNQVISLDEQQGYQGLADVAAAAQSQAEAERDLAQLNLDRSVIRAPANGFVTNLTLRVGDFATAGVNQVSIVDSDSFYVLGYFEETKLRRIRLGARAAVRLMEGGPTIEGHVESISRGITDVNAQPDDEGLANVNPVFTWVRLAQRIPVRIHIDRVPPKVQILSGITCTITIDEWRSPVSVAATQPN